MNDRSRLIRLILAALAAAALLAGWLLTTEQEIRLDLNADSEAMPALTDGGSISQTISADVNRVTSLGFRIASVQDASGMVLRLTAEDEAGRRVEKEIPLKRKKKHDRLSAETEGLSGGKVRLSLAAEGEGSIALAGGQDGLYVRITGMVTRRGWSLIYLGGILLLLAAAPVGRRECHEKA